MIFDGEDIRMRGNEKFNHLWNPSMTRDIALRLLFFYQEQNLRLRVSA